MASGNRARARRVFRCLPLPLQRASIKIYNSIYHFLFTTEWKKKFAVNTLKAYRSLPPPLQAVAQQTNVLPALVSWSALEELYNCISKYPSLHADHVRSVALAVDEWLADDEAVVDRVHVHRDIGIALYNRSPQLYCGEDLPDFLRRYTYPPFMSVALNTHCNAACFFCREADYKGELVNFDDLKRLDAGIRNTRVVEFTGWGEPFS